MTLVSSGQISLAGSGASNQSIEYEIYSTTDQQIDILSADCRALCGIATGAVKFSDFYSKSMTPVMVSFTSTPTMVTEGYSVTFEVTTKYVRDNTVLYWKIVGDANITLGDFVLSALSGQFSVINNKVTGAITTAVDAFNEGAETFHIEIYSDITMTNQFGFSSPTVTIAPNGTYVVAQSGTYDFIVPAGVTRVTVITALGGGGGSYAYHDGGYGEHAFPGGPGGGVSNVVIPVNVNDVLSAIVGKGGGAGYYNGTDRIGYGAAGTSTLVTLNASLIFECYSSSKTMTPNTSVIQQQKVLSGSTAVGTAGVRIDSVDGAKYNVYSPLAYAKYKNNPSTLGTQAIPLSAYPYAGLAECDGIIIFTF